MWANIAEGKDDRPGSEWLLSTGFPTAGLEMLDALGANSDLFVEEVFPCVSLAALVCGAETKEVLLELVRHLGDSRSIDSAWFQSPQQR